MSTQHAGHPRPGTQKDDARNGGGRRKPSLKMRRRNRQERRLARLRAAGLLHPPQRRRRSWEFPLAYENLPPCKGAVLIGEVLYVEEDAA